MSRRLLLGATLAAVVLAACAGDPPGQASPAATGDPTNTAPAEWTGVTRNVPAGYPTIQAAVDAADPGDLVLVDEGVYKETVQINTPGLTLRGVDRNEVIIDGEFERFNGVEILFTDGVVVENLTVRNNTNNGVFWTGVRGYRGSYVTAINNGNYGIYSFDSGDGLFEHLYGSGHPDSSYYIGQCDPCEAVLRDSVGELNGLGYSGTNASAELYIVNNVFRRNYTGIAPNSQYSELLPPAEDVTIAGNLVYNNGLEDVPHKDQMYWVKGTGIALGGVENSLVTRNRIFNHPNFGIHVHFFPTDNTWMSGDNTVTENVIEGSRIVDMAMSGPSLPGNCFEGNEHSSTLPPMLEFKQSCDGLRFPALWEMGSITPLFGQVVEEGLGLDPDVFYGDTPHPPDQAQLPGGADAPVRPAVNVYASEKPDLDAITTPAMPSDLEVTIERGINIMGVSFGSTIGGVVGLYAYVLPMVLYAAWVGIALWEIIKRDDLSRGAGIGWMFAIFLVPFLGVIAYYVFGRSKIPAVYRWVMVLGGMGTYAAFLIAGLVFGGIL